MLSLPGTHITSNLTAYKRDVLEEAETSGSVEMFTSICFPSILGHPRMCVYMVNVWKVSSKPEFKNYNPRLRHLECVTQLHVSVSLCAD